MRALVGLLGAVACLRDPGVADCAEWARARVPGWAAAEVGTPLGTPLVADLPGGGCAGELPGRGVVVVCDLRGCRAPR